MDKKGWKILAIVLFALLILDFLGDYAKIANEEVDVSILCHGPCEENELCFYTLYEKEEDMCYLFDESKNIIDTISIDSILE